MDEKQEVKTLCNVTKELRNSLMSERRKPLRNSFSHKFTVKTLFNIRIYILMFILAFHFFHEQCLCSVQL